MFKSIHTSIATIAMAALSVSACESAPSYNALGTTPITSGFFSTKGVTISADDGSFQLVGGQPFRPPFQSNMYCTQCAMYFLDQVDLLDPNALLNIGGRRVTVSLADGQKLYGVLALNQVFNQLQVESPALFQFFGPSLRSYEINIPEARIQQALAGNSTVAYEVFAIVPAEYSATGQARNFRSWVLQLSRTPF